MPRLLMPSPTSTRAASPHHSNRSTSFKQGAIRRSIRSSLAKNECSTHCQCCQGFGGAVASPAQDHASSSLSFCARTSAGNSLILRDQFDDPPQTPNTPSEVNGEGKPDRHLLQQRWRRSPPHAGPEEVAGRFGYKFK